jgi:hypothetical protein
MVSTNNPALVVTLLFWKGAGSEAPAKFKKPGITRKLDIATNTY